MTMYKFNMGKIDGLVEVLKTQFEMFEVIQKEDEKAISCFNLTKDLYYRVLELQDEIEDIRKDLTVVETVTRTYYLLKKLTEGDHSES